jgi:hypothetical protein
MRKRYVPRGESLEDRCVLDAAQVPGLTPPSTMITAPPIGPPLGTTPTDVYPTDPPPLIAPPDTATPPDPGLC